MSTSPPDAVPFDAHGIEPIPESSRDCSPWELFWIWSGANIAPINWVLGALGITLGLSLIETLVVVALGNVIGCAVFGVFNVIGHRTAVNQMVLGRAPFGRLGSVVPGVVQLLLTMGWVGVNTWVVLDLVMAMLAEVGVAGGLWLEVGVAAAMMAVQLGLALYGFYAIRSFEKYTVPATVLVMALMTVMAIVTTDVNWTLAGTAMEPGAKITAVTQLLTAIGIGWGLTWIPYASDYSRFVRVSASPRAVFWSSSLGMYIPTVWLAALGACLASAGSGSDPSTLVVGTFGVMAIPVLLLLVHGPIATNILNLYSCSLAALSIGVRAARWKVTLVAGVVASGVLAVFVNADSFAHAFDNWMVSILVWISPWAAIMLVDYFVLRRGALDVATLYLPGETSGHGRFNVGGLVSLAAGIVAGWAWQYGLVPAMQGPVATALGNTDFSWLSGSLVAGGLYYLFSRSSNLAAVRGMTDDTILPDVVSATTLSNSFLGKLIEVCFVTADHRRTMEGLVRLGIGPWRVYTFDSATVTERTYRGEAADFGIKVCFADVGDIAFEIMEPLYGPSIFQEFLDTHGEGIQHIAFDCDEQPWDARIAEFTGRGFPLTQSGRFMDANAFAFFDTEKATGTTFETYSIPAGFVWPEPEEWYPGPPPAGQAPPVREQGDGG